MQDDTGTITWLAQRRSAEHWRQIDREQLEIERKHRANLRGRIRMFEFEARALVADGNSFMAAEARKYVATLRAELRDTCRRQSADRVDWRQGLPEAFPAPHAVASSIRPQRPRRSRARERRDGSRRHSTRGSTSGDESGEPEPPPACEGCGAELLTPARFCGFCAVEHGERRCSCAICGRDISHRRSHAETCCDTHKKQLQRQRAKAREPVPTVAPRPVPPDPLDGVDPHVLWCVYQNRGLELVAA
jgi:hypothetical protein